MRCGTFGRSELKVSSVALGTFQFSGGWGEFDAADADAHPPGGADHGDGVEQHRSGRGDRVVRGCGADRGQGRAGRGDRGRTCRQPVAWGSSGVSSGQRDLERRPGTALLAWAGRTQEME